MGLSQMNQTLISPQTSVSRMFNRKSGQKSNRYSRVNTMLKNIADGSTGNDRANEQATH